jgi:hypothetical protein
MFHSDLGFLQKGSEEWAKGQIHSEYNGNCGGYILF